MFVPSTLNASSILTTHSENSSRLPQKKGPSQTKLGPVGQQKWLRCSIENQRQCAARLRYDLNVVTITLQLTDETARELGKRASRAGVSLEAIAARELSRGIQDPFEFVGIGDADVSALETDQLLGNGFGTA
jgi:hypothetical protein